MASNTFGSIVGELTALIDDLIVELNIRWKLHRELFQVDAYYSLFAKSGAGVWSVLGDALMDNVFMSASRLLDPAASCGRQNLSFEQIIKSLPRSSEQNQISDDYRRVKDRYDSTLKDWRNWKLSHNSLDVAKGALALRDVSFKDVASLIDGINALAHSLGLTIRNIDQTYVPAVANQDWVWRLIDVLKKGIRPSQD